jgi:hypothetical protein
MDFTLDTEQKALRDAIRDLASRRTPADEIGAATHDTDLWKALADVGALALPFEEGAGPVEVMIVAEELGRARARSAYAEMLVAGHVLADTGHELVEAIGEGAAVVVPALAQPGRAWSLDSSVAATQSGQGWTLSGVKEPVPYGEAASHVVVTTDRGVFLVEGPSVAGGRLALDGTPATLLTDDTTVLQAAVNRATAALCAEALGAMESAVSLTVEYLKTRKQFGVPLASFQTLTQRAADLYVHLELARSTVQYAAMALAEEPGDSDLVSRTKVVVGKAGRLIGQEAIQLHGGIGVTAEYAVGHLTARLTAIEHTYGDTRHHLGRLAAGVSSYGSVAVV